MKTLYLHFGTHKTGSTSIQNFLYGCREELQKIGFYYPTEGSYFYSGESSQSLFAHSLIDARPKYISKNVSWDKASCISDLKRDLENSKSPNTIISSEHFSSIKTQDSLVEIKDIFTNYFENIKIIIYLRRQDHFFESRYNQQVKAGLITATFEEVLKDFLGNYNYNDYIEMLSNVFGKANIIIRPFEKSQLHMQNVVHDFFKILHLNIDGNIQDDINKSIPTEMSEVIRLFNNNFDNHSQRQRFYKFIKTSSIDFDKTLYTILSPRLRKEILDFHREGNYQVAKNYLGRENGLLFYEPEVSSKPLYPGIATERFAEISAEIFLLQYQIYQKIKGN
ncbi:hypothetical protein [Candidatus Methylopumilus turicensis]|uniref:Sulfotransferase domain-containing protein n=1 Tax=Candidatus Methylopumilus turicensis TaxID=1581680 RepID=A0A0B7IYQ6_9PROT|nr:hypothetical protein [Candidatus Methylopumilus turicensis]CEN56199.1 conserved protein of unknown function [Candidatus Methylopumilus turicensis]